MEKRVQTEKRTAKADPAHGAPTVDPNFGHHPPALSTPDPEPPHPGAKGQSQPRARARMNEHGRGRNPK